MKVKFGNLNKTGVGLRLIPSVLGISDLGSQTGAVIKDGEVVNIYLDKYAKPIISCADALTGICFLGSFTEMIAGKNIAVTSGVLTKTYEVVSPAPANIVDLLNAEFEDFFAVATDTEGWVIDTLNATVIDDIRVSITPVQNDDWSLATWKSDKYVDRHDVEHGLNTTLLQDGGSLNFCMSLYAALPQPRCHTFTPQQIANLKNRSTGLTTLYKGKYPIGDNYMTINGQYVETSTVDGKLVIADNPYMIVETLVDNKPAFSRKTTTLAGKIVVRICSGFPIDEADTPFWGMEDDGMIGTYRGYRDTDGYETVMFVFNTPQDVPDITCVDATENVKFDIEYTQEETPRFNFKLNGVAQNYLYNDPLSPLVVTPETPLTGPMTLSLNPNYDFGEETTIRFMNLEFEYGNTLDEATGDMIRSMSVATDNANTTVTKNSDRSFNFCLAKPAVDPGISCAPTILTVVPTLTSTSLNTSEQYTITYSVNNGPDVVASGLPVYTEPGFPTADPCLALSGLLRINDPTVNGVSYNSFFGFNFPTVEGYEVYDTMPENAASFTIKLKKTEPANLVGTDLVWLMFEQDEVIMHSCWFDTGD